MTDTDTSVNPDPTDDGAEGDTGKQNWRRDLERRAREGDEARAAAAAARMELALLKAGIDLDTPTGKLFAKAYDGEPTADAVKAAAAEYGLAGPTATPDVPADELAAHARVTSAAAGGSAPTEYDNASAELKAVQLYDAAGNLNVNAHNAVLKVMRDNGIPVVDASVTKWIDGPEDKYLG